MLQEDMVMLRQLLVGGVVSICNIVIHALIMAAVILVAQLTAARSVQGLWPRLVSVMVCTVSVLMVAHVFEVVVWSLAYSLVDAAPPDGELMYFAFVNY